MLISPCCGASLQNGVRSVAGLELFTSAGFFLAGLITLQKFANASKVADGDESGGDVPSLLFGIAYLIFSISQFALAVVLLCGANRKSITHCAKWFLGAWILLIILLIFAGCETYQGRLTPTILWAKPVFLALNGLLKLYCIWVVYSFMQSDEIRHTQAADYRKTPMI